MSGLQEIFNNREIALAIWLLIAIAVMIFSNPGREFIRTAFPILFCRKFVIFYIVFLSYFGLVIYGLFTIGFWDTSLLKDTIFWILFVELPLFAKTIEKAKDNHFFKQLIKENIALIVIVNFLLNFWPFGLITEIIIVPIIIIISISSALAARKIEHRQAKHFFDWIITIFVVVVIIYTVQHIVQKPNEIMNDIALKEFLLPSLLLILNLPIVYGLALYKTYEQIFIRVKGNKIEKPKIKRRIFFFAGIYLSKISAVLNHLGQTVIISLTEKDMKNNLDKLEERLSMQVGENYMKRTRFYIIWCIIGLFVCFIGLVWSSNYIQLKDIFVFDFTFDSFRIREIITYICSCGIAVLFCFLIYAIGLQKKKSEEISLVKKYSLYNFFYLINRQNKMLQEFPPIDEPKELFVQYITMAYELKIECDKSIILFENLLKSWELDEIKQLQLSLNRLIQNIGIDENEIIEYSAENFEIYYENKKLNAPQNEKINVFINDIQRGIEKYSEQIRRCSVEFKPYF